MAPTATPDFAALIDRVRAGDGRAATELVHRYEPELRRLVRVRLSGQLARVFDSVDICQSVLGNFFIRAANGQFDLNSPSQLIALLATMAKNKLRDHARRPVNSKQMAGDNSGYLAQLPATGDTPSQQIALQDLLAAVRGRMSEEERHLADARAAGREWADIATERGAQPDALRKQLSRAVERAAGEIGLDTLPGF